ncbi:hypothetical protein Rsub_09096 [Raphidocelis subcapitata]|uniref:Tyrosyl-DNA phosphodiesterase n=1 Tax=Raphidocelis subcapitata TaxID=307507 RepID=A0A2V0P8W0_9CHLO|nr:hypothetical protein Rsub_09096 [Raphidocelis subcapitata]|eukprot:GBF96301.1 hypothetical protein Rsub_09096 [Raphidocelis subcapitata]
MYIELPGGAPLPVDGGRPLVLQRAHVADEFVSRSGQWQVQLVAGGDGVEGLLWLRVIGPNRTVVRLAGGEEAAVLTSADEGLPLTAGCAFAIQGREPTTTCRTVAGAPHKRARGDGGSGGGDGADKRRRAGGDTQAFADAAAPPAAAAAGADGGGPPEAWLRADCPVRLLALPGLPERDNTGALGARLGDLVSGPIRLAVVMNYMVDMEPFLKECPDIERAEQVFVIHGENSFARADALRRGVAALRRGVVLTGDGQPAGGVNFGMPPPGGGSVDGEEGRPLAPWVLHRPAVLPRGTHHTKAFLLLYDLGLRVVVHTANILFGDIRRKTQGAYSQDFPPKDAHSPPSSPFEEALSDYMAAYKLREPEAAAVRGAIARHDFSSARIALAPSVPGRHTGPALFRYGHLRVRSLLSQEPMPPSWRGLPVVLQFTSLGAFEEAWLMRELVPSFTAGAYAAAGGQQQQQQQQQLQQQPGAGRSPAKLQLSLDGFLRRSPTKQAPGGGGGGGGSAAAATAAAESRMPAPGPELPPDRVHLVWPTLEELANCWDGWRAGGSIPGPEKNVSRPFLQPLWRRWGGAPSGRARVMPHIKTFLRFDPASRRLPWVIVGSHNLSIAAWGKRERPQLPGGGQLYLPSYELSVLLLPSLEAAHRRHRHRGFVAWPAPGGGGGGGDGAAEAQEQQQQAAPAAVQTEQQQAAAASSSRGGGSGGGAAGVAFFAARQADPAAAAAAGAEAVLLPVPFPLPPAPYRGGDKPWMWNSDGDYYEGRKDLLGFEKWQAFSEPPPR